jgi:hypothetical protein
MTQSQNLERKERRNPADNANSAVLESKRVRCTTHVVCLFLQYFRNGNARGRLFFQANKGPCAFCQVLNVYSIVT